MVQEDVIIKRVNGNTYDIFWDIGWENHIRILLKGEFFTIITKRLVPSYVKKFIANYLGA